MICNETVSVISGLFNIPLTRTRGKKSSEIGERNMPRPFSIVIHARTGERRKYPINRESNSPDTPRNPINFPSPALFPPISTVFTTREHNLSCCFRINFTQSFADSLLNSFKVNILRDAIKNSKRFA